MLPSKSYWVFVITFTKIILKEEGLFKSYYKQSPLHFGLIKILVYFKCYFPVEVCEDSADKSQATILVFYTSPHKSYQKI